MNMFVEDFMPRTAKAREGLRRVREHHRWRYEKAAKDIVSVNRQIEEGVLLKEALYSECTYQDDKIDEAWFAVKYWRWEVAKAAALEGGLWVGAILILVASAL